MKKKWITVAIISVILLCSALIIPFASQWMPGSDEQEETEHIHTFYERRIEATCDEAGSLYYCCYTCYYMEGAPIPALGHTWGEWEVTLESTEDSTGERQRSCTVCEQMETAEIAKLPEQGHEHDYVKSAVEPTCTAGGYYECTCACGDSYKGEALAALGHDWSAWVVTKKATTTTTGTIERACETCGEVETDTIPKKDPEVHQHAYTTVWYAPTCTEGGYNLHSCGCGHSYQSDNVVALGHSYGEWETTVEPTTSSTGERRCICVTCGDVKTETVPALDPETGETYESYIDPRIKVTKLRRGTAYKYNDCRVYDYRTWGTPPSIWVNEDGSLQVVYFQQDGTRVDVKVCVPNEGYIRSCDISDDGTYVLCLVGGLN